MVIGMEFSRNILMGDPACFAIKKGANPHTRNWLGLRKRVDVKRAQAQWEKMTGLLSDYGVKIHVIPADPELPGLVFPANAGVMIHVEEKIPLAQREFILSRLNLTRSTETHVYQKFLRRLGIVTHQIGRQFEGEADFIPWGEKYIFTYGKILKQKFCPYLGLPPWKRVYGFRSDGTAWEELTPRFPGKEILKLELSQEAFYHGDTVFCSFGSRREFLLAYLPGIQKGDQKKISGNPHLIPLSEQDAWSFAANSFQVIHKGQCVLFMPEGAGASLRKLIEKKGVQTLMVDVSEFFLKGGGSVKCLVGDLGA